MVLGVAAAAVAVLQQPPEPRPKPLHYISMNLAERDGPALHGGAAFGLLFGAFLAASVEHGGLLLGNQQLAKHF